MKTNTLLAILFSISLIPALAARADVVIVDFSIGGSTGHANNEFIRLENSSSLPFDLAGFKITQTKFSEKNASCAEETLVPASKLSEKSIPGSGEFLIAHPDYEGSDAVDVFYAKSNTLTSSTMGISLLDTQGTVITERVIGTKCQASPIPNPIAPPVPQTYAVRLNEIFPNPAERGEANEFIELYNDADAPVSLTGWLIRKNRSESGQYAIKASDFPAGTIIPAHGLFLIPRAASGFVMANSDKIISLHSPDGKEMSAVQYEKTKEAVSLNYTPTGWHGGAPTPGMVNSLNTLPQTRERVPKQGYRDVPVALDARGSDADNNALKYTWDFGDGHKSYKEKTTHVYAENGTYIIRLTTTDGVEDTTETFTLRIRKYDPPEVRITSLMPNPKGADTGSEWISLINREKKAINLKGFSIATGWKTLSNHLVRTDFILAPKMEVKLTHASSLFTLPNQKGRIELRAPNGETLQKIKYKLDKAVADDVIYFKEKNAPWKWRTGETKSSQQKTINSGLEEREAPAPKEIPAPINQEQSKTDGETNTDTEKPRAIIDGELSQNPDRLRLIDLLSYGTHVKVPDERTFVPADVTPDESTLTEPEHYAVAYTEELFTALNASLNDLLDRSGTH